MGRVNRVWLPIEDRSIVRYFNRHLYFPHRFRERLTAGVRRMPLLDRSRLPKPPDVTARIGRTRGEPPGTSGVAESNRGPVADEDSHTRRLQRVGEIVTDFAEHVSDFGPNRSGSAGQRGDRWILIEDGTRAERVIVILFAPGQTRPFQILKMVPEGVDSLRRERQALVDLGSALPKDLASTLPQVGALERVDGWEVLPLSVIEGRPAYVELQASWHPRRAAARHLQSAVRWLVRFQRSTGSDRVLFETSDERERLIRWAEWLEEAGIESTSVLESLFARCLRRPIRLCSGHGDFWARNVLVVQDRRRSEEYGLPGVIDWESYRPRQEPFVDLFHFAVTYGLNFPWVRYRRLDAVSALHHTFIDDNDISQEIRRYFAFYCEEMEVDLDTLRSLFRVYLARLSCHDARAEFAWSVRSHRDRDAWLNFHERFRIAERTVFDG